MTEKISFKTAILGAKDMLNIEKDGKTVYQSNTRKKIQVIFHKSMDLLINSILHNK